MQNAWRFVKDEALRERLKEAKGIGTPATRAEIIKGLKRQNLLAADGKLVVPTPAGLQLFELLRAAAPALVDPGTTAVWEMRLDDVVVGKADFRAVIDEIAGEADRLITVLRQHNGSTVDLSQPVSVRSRRGRSKVGRKSRAGGHAAATSDVAKPKRAARAERRTHRINRWMSAGRMAAPSPSGRHQAGQRLRPARMVAFAEEACQGQEGHPAIRLRTKISTSAAASLINTLGVRKALQRPRQLRPPTRWSRRQPLPTSAATPSAVWGRADAPPACRACVLVTPKWMLTLRLTISTLLGPA